MTTSTRSGTVRRAQGLPSGVILLVLFGIAVFWGGIYVRNSLASETNDGKPSASYSCATNNPIPDALAANSPGKHPVKAGEWSPKIALQGWGYRVYDKDDKELRTGFTFEYFGEHGKYRFSVTGGDTDDDTQFARYRYDGNKDTYYVVERLH